ncbi:MAG: hypothetical protein JOY92_02320 [Verrucomicrobia bacterium]|nr:hypothetical protein [Verrucomicrobiota bacterium]
MLLQDVRAFVAEAKLPRVSPDEPAPDPQLLSRIEAITDSDLGLPERQKAACVRALLWYAAGDLHAAHEIVQPMPGPDGAYIHGMIHRVEDDFDNARYWFSRAAAHPASAEIYRHAVVNSTAIAAHPLWDPVYVTDLLEQSRRTGISEELVTVLRIEFEELFNYLTDTKTPVI